MQERGIEDRVQVRTFHSWCYQMLRTYGIPPPSEAEFPDYNDRLAASVRCVEAETMLGHIPGGRRLVAQLRGAIAARWLL
jgi:hypothetical protein